MSSESLRSGQLTRFNFKVSFEIMKLNKGGLVLHYGRPWASGNTPLITLPTSYLDTFFTRISMVVLDLAESGYKN